MDEEDIDEENKKCHRILKEPLVEKQNKNQATDSTLKYGLESSPPFAILLLTGIQHIIVNLPGCLLTSTLVADAVCAPYDHPLRANLFCGTLFMTGICTLMTTFFGIRLPVFQGPSAAFFLPLLSMQTDPDWKCSENILRPEETNGNGTTNLSIATENEASIEMYTKLQMMSGSLLFASLIEVVFGSMGLMGLMLRYIGPITVACTISLIGVCLLKAPITYGQSSFPVALGSMILISIFTLYCQNVKIPIPRCNKGKKGKKGPHWLAVFQFIPILIGLVIMWLISWVLTIAGTFSDDKSSMSYFARTDSKSDIISLSPWFQLTYPGMFGPPKMSIPLALGFCIACIASMVESVGDYYATSKACEVEIPPNHAISRGIFVEGIGTLISGAVGVGHATTSYSGNISILTLSKTACRSVMYVAGVVLILISLLGKVGAAMTTMPNPILGGIMIIIIAALTAIGLSNLKQVDMSSTRNLLVFGLPFTCGMIFPMTLEKYPGMIDTGFEHLDKIIQVIFGSHMFVGGLLAFFLDNTVPGTYASRGMKDPREIDPFDEGPEKNSQIYSWTLYPKLVKSLPFLTFLPFMPGKPLSDSNESNDESNVIC